MNEAAAVRASVERGDPFAHMGPAALQRRFTRSYHTPLNTALTTPPEADPPQPVTADPEALDPEPDRNYPDGVSHGVESDGRQAAGEAAHRATHTGAPPSPSFWTAGPVAKQGAYSTGFKDAPEAFQKAAEKVLATFDREAWLARVQRIDPRERRRWVYEDDETTGLAGYPDGNGERW